MPGLAGFQSALRHFRRFRKGKLSKSLQAEKMLLVHPPPSSILTSSFLSSFLPSLLPPQSLPPSIPLLPPFPPLLPSLLPPFLLPLPPFPLSPSIHSSGLLVTLESSSRLSFIGHQGPAGLVPHSALGVANTARNFPWATSHGWLFRKHGELWMSQDGRIHNSVRQSIWRLPGSPTLLSRQAPGPAAICTMCDCRVCLGGKPEEGHTKL